MVDSNKGCVLRLNYNDDQYIKFSRLWGYWGGGGKDQHEEDVERLNKKIAGFTQENQLLRDDNACFKSLIDNDCHNPSLI